MTEEQEIWATGGPWPDVMVDLETFGTGARAAIISIGVVCFDAERGEVGSPRKWDPDWRQPGRKVDQGTLAWWFQRQQEGILVPRGNQPLEECLVELNDSLDEVAEPALRRRMWSKGPSFDLAILADAFRWAELGATIQPWRHWNERCVRTALENAECLGWVRCRAKAAHDALEDATAQAREVMAALRFLAQVADRDLSEADHRAGWEVYRKASGGFRWEELPMAMRDAWKEAVSVASGTGKMANR